MDFFAPKSLSGSKKNSKFPVRRTVATSDEEGCCLVCVVHYGCAALGAVPKMVAGLYDVYAIDRDHIMKFI